jgi:hypothetical protein
VTVFRLVDITIWALAAGFMSRGAWAAAKARGVRYGDPMGLACFATAIVIIGFNARCIFATDSVLFWMLLYALSGAVGIYIVVLGHRYGRGPRI